MESESVQGDLGFSMKKKAFRGEELGRDGFPYPPKILKTREYDKFTFVPKFNRDKNEDKVDDLFVENQSEFRLHENPVIVDEKFRIISGQHRFLTSKRLNAPVYFMVKKGKVDIAHEILKNNIVGDSMNAKEILKNRFHAGDLRAKKVYKLAERFIDLDVDKIVLAHLCHDFSNGGTFRKALIRETWETDYHGKVVKLLKHLVDLDFEDKKSNSFIYALAWVIKEFDKSIPALFERLYDVSDKLRKQSTMKDYKTHIIEIHDKNLPKKKRLDKSPLKYV